MISSSRLRVLTFKARDVEQACLRDAASQLMQAGRETLRSLDVPGYALKMETSVREDLPDLFHPHLHALVDAPTSGRNHISRARWQEAWLDALPSRFRPIEEGVYVRPVQTLGAYCSYMTKSPFGAHVDNDKLPVDCTLCVIREQQGVKRWATWGSLAA